MPAAPTAKPLPVASSLEPSASSLNRSSVGAVRAASPLDDWSQGAPVESMPLATKPRPPARRKQPPPWIWPAIGGALALVAFVVLGIAWIGGDGGTSRAASKTLASVSPPAASSPRPSAPAPPAPAASASPSPAPIPSPTPSESKLKVAKTFDEVTNAIVKFEMPVAGGKMVSGTGFLINDRGWIATNNHVASMISTAARAKTATGQRLEIEGIVATAPERDLAIVKLKELPTQAMLLDISYEDRPNRGKKVYTYGHPMNNDFSLSDGIVSRVLTTGELAAEQPGNVTSQMHAPPDSLWIQTTAKTLPGNSGGPLLDEDCRVVGINTFMNTQTNYGFAGHVKYLKMLANRPVGALAPLKAPSEVRAPSQPVQQPVPGVPMPQIVVSKEAIEQLMRAAEGFGWKPAKPEDYQILANLAALLTLAKQPKAPPESAALVDPILAKLKAIPWNAEHADALNRHAPAHLTAPGHGVLFVGALRGKGNGPDGKPNALILEAPGFADWVLVPSGAESLNLSDGSRLLAIGAVLPQIVEAQIPGQPQPRKIRMVQPLLLLPVQ